MMRRLISRGLGQCQAGVVGKAALSVLGVLYGFLDQAGDQPQRMPMTLRSSAIVSEQHTMTPLPETTFRLLIERRA